MLADHCTLYNAALQERRDAYAHPSQTKIRSRSRFDTVEFPKDGDGCRWESVPHDRQTRVRLQGVGHVRVHQHRPIAGTVKTISVKWEGNRWYVILSCDDVPAEPLPATGRVVGIDMGVTHFLVTSADEYVTNPRPTRSTADRLAAAQRALDAFPKKVRATNRTRKHRLAARKVARLNAKVRRERLDHAHKAANFLVRSADVIAHENLAVVNMVRRPKPRQSLDGTYAPNGAAAKAGLNRSILDAGWGVFLEILTHKAECAGRKLISVNPAQTSRACPACGHVAKENRDREIFECTACGHRDHADHVAALNIAQRAGLALRAVA
ncbi:RNA-guided endonuclease InsQ/TnpB family protein [Spirillospora sp. CA-128828]|uniref:RNA-guided endonuclease InsQ/TnpB family protein n=1 Tax=Spirillospora sp. CA-128828 TaxID=3240033 RepID=UPI003D8A84D8